jgi:4-amino-4-deoxy-L-arabinose transferase-like glycosyltransferase
MTTTDATRPDAAAVSSRHRWIALWPYALIALVGLLILLPRLGDYGLWDPWEPKYAQSVREMLDRDSYLIPYYREEARLAKPILTYWSIMAGSAVFGLNEFGARIGGVLAAVGSLLAVCYAVTRLRGRRAGLLAALVLCTLPQFHFLARQVSPDVYLFSGLGLSLLFLALGMFVPDERRNLHLFVSYVCFALSVMAKGPIVSSGILFPTLLLFTFVRVDWRWFWRPELRNESRQMLITLGVGSLAIGTLACTALLYATSPEVWGWSTDVHAILIGVRDRITATASRWWFTELLLVVTIAVAVTAGVHLIRRRDAARRSVTGVLLSAAPLALMGIGAVWGLLEDDPATRMLFATTLGALTGLGLLAGSVLRFIRLPAVGEDARAHAGFVGRQVLTFCATVLVVAGPWYGIVLVRKSSLFVNDFIVYNHITRATETINATGAFDFYWHVLAYGFFPWSCLLPVAVGALVIRHGRNPLGKSAVEAFLVLACVVCIAAFSSSVTKFSHYLAPTLIPLAVLLGLTLDQILRTSSEVFRRVAWIAAFVLYLPMSRDLLTEYGSIYLVGAFTIKRWVPDTAAPGPFFAVVLVAIGGILLVAAFVRSRILVGALIAASVAFSFYCSAFFVPRLGPHKTMKHLCATWQQHRSADESVGFLGPLKHGIYFYCDSRIELLDEDRFLTFMAPPQQAFSIVRRNMVPDIAARYRESYPEGMLRIANDSHFRYVLLVNRDPRALALHDAKSR